MNDQDPFRSPSAIREGNRDANASNDSRRIMILGVSVAMAFILYLDRICLGEILKTVSFNSDLKLLKEEKGYIISAFFFAYALFQLPAGMLSDRFGARRMLTLYIVSWSLLTLFTGAVTGFLGLFLCRMFFGIAQAGAYPASSGVIRRWFMLSNRGKASSTVALGGRIGGAVAPLLTTSLIVGAGLGWRRTLVVYAFVGITISIVYMIIVRDRPEASDDDLSINTDEKKPASLADMGPLVFSFCGHSGLWLNSAAQFFVNVGWAFLVNWLPTYLSETQKIPELRGAWIVTGVLAVGMIGQLIGGWSTDAAATRFGLRWGRVIPIAISSTIASLAYLGCLFFGSNVWIVVACCATVSLMTDIGNPCTWAFMQDIGGKNTAATMAWANMWGNFGAAFSGSMVPLLLKLGAQSDFGQQLVFSVCAGAFLLAAICALGMNAAIPLSKSRAEVA